MPYNVPRHTGLAAYPALERARASAQQGAARGVARLLEQQGRGGDTRLVHVNDRELAAIRGAFGPGGGVGRRNPATGLESFAPEEESTVGDTFVGTSPDGSDSTMRLPLDVAPADLAAAAEFNLSSLKPGISGQRAPFQDQMPVFSALTGTPPPSFLSLAAAFGGSAPSPAADTAARQAQFPSPRAVTAEPDLPAGAVAVVRPDGQKLVVRNDKDEESGLLSPKADLSDVAAAGRATRQTYEDLLNGSDPGAANIFLGEALFTYLAHGGLFDYQREGPQLEGWAAEKIPFLQKFKQHPAYQPVSNFNVGLFSQQAGFTLQETLDKAHRFAEHFSSNYMPDQPDGLDPKVRTYIIQGWNAGKDGVFDPPSGRQDRNQ